MKRDDRTQNIVISFFLFIIALAVIAKCAKADEPEPIVSVPPEKVRPVVLSTIAALQFAYADELKPDPLPPVFMTKLYGVAGVTVGGKIYLNDTRPAGCFAADLAHEAAHWLLGKYRGSTPDQSETAARYVEHIVSPEETNCWSEK